MSLSKYPVDDVVVVATVDVVVAEVFRVTVGCTADTEDAFEDDLPNCASVSGNYVS